MNNKYYLRQIKENTYVSETHKKKSKKARKKERKKAKK